MLDLAALQLSMTRAIFDGSLVDIAGEFDTGGANPERRFAIYRNNTFLSLTSHLRTVFAVTAKLGDERFFAYAAHEFILRAPPRESRLVTYGAGFPAFLSRFPACRHVPILAQMAALEWAIHRALTSPQAPFLEASDMTGVSEDITVDLQPGLQFIVSRWPLLGLWARQDDRLLPLQRQLSRVAVVRHDDDIRFFELGSARFAFWRSLARRRSLAKATAHALARDPFFSLVDEIVFLLRNRLVAGIEAVNQQKGSEQ